MCILLFPYPINTGKCVSPYFPISHPINRGRCVSPYPLIQSTEEDVCPLIPLFNQQRKMCVPLSPYSINKGRCVSPYPLIQSTEEDVCLPIPLSNQHRKVISWLCVGGACNWKNNLWSVYRKGKVVHRKGEMVHTCKWNDFGSLASWIVYWI